MLVPALLTLAFNSWDAPDGAAFVRMAFAGVAGCTIAIATAIGLLIDRIARKAPASTIGLFAVIAVAVTLWQVQLLSIQADLLLQRLGTIG